MIRVTLVGPDGCGKSAVTAKLLETLPIPARRIYMGVNLESSHIMLPTSWLLLLVRRWRGVPPDTDGPRNPHRCQTRSGGFLKQTLKLLKSAARTTNLIAEECFRLTVIRWWLFFGFVVIQDRDFFIDFYEYDISKGAPHRTLFQRIHGCFLRWFYRKPHMTILLDVSAETMLARKSEGTEEELERRRQHYRELVVKMPAYAVVNAAGTLEEVTTLCRDAILNYRQRRIAERQRKIADVTNAPPAIVIGLDCVTGLQTARLLASRGVRVIGVASHAAHFCCRTNAVEQTVIGATHGPGLLEHLKSLHTQFELRPVLIPCTDLSVLTISKHRQELQSYYSFVLPEHHLLESLIDKVRFAGFAETHGFKVPKTRVLKSRADARTAADMLAFPVFVKPSIKTPVWESNTKLKAVRVDSPAALLVAWDSYSALSDSLIAQEYIPGDVDECFTVNVYFDRNAKPVCTYASQKMRQWPPGFGTACLARQCENSEVTRRALEFFQSINYSGTGYLEFKRDIRSGEYLIIEPNIGRPTGRSAMAEASGVPLLLSMYFDAAQIATAVTAEVPQSTSLKWIHLRRDLQAAFHLWKRGELTVSDWFKSVRGQKIFAVLSWNDPAPFLAEIRNYVLQLVLPRPLRPAAATPAPAMQDPEIIGNGCIDADDMLQERNRMLHLPDMHRSAAHSRN